jgi:hypothetical protein
MTMRESKMESTFKVISISILLFVFLLTISFILVTIFTNEAVRMYCRECLGAEPYQMLGASVDLLALSATILLGIAVYHQAQKINNLESSQYDVFIGAVKRVTDYRIGDSLLTEKENDPNYFTVWKDLSSEKKSYLVLSGFDNDVSVSTQNPIFVPISFLIKCYSVLTFIKIEKISVGIDSYQKDWRRRKDSPAICEIFEDNSSFIFGFSLMIPKEKAADVISLTIWLSTSDHIGRIHNKTIEMILKNSEMDGYVLFSSRSINRNSRII